MTKRFLKGHLKRGGASLSTEAFDSLFRRFYGCTDQEFKKSKLLQTMLRQDVCKQIFIDHLYPERKGPK